VLALWLCSISAVYADDSTDSSSAVTTPPVATVQEKTAIAIKSIYNDEAGIALYWSRQKESDGYIIYRRGTDSYSWTKVKTIKGGSVVFWIDKKARDGMIYSYSIYSYKNVPADSANLVQEDYSTYSTSYRLAVPLMKSCDRTSSKSVDLRWETSDSVTGYEIQYSLNKVFTKPVSVTVDGTQNSLTINNLDPGKEYYFRIRKFKTADNGRNQYSFWSLSSNVKKSKTLKVSVIKIDGKAFEIRSKARQKVFGYDTVQGATTDGTYVYYLLNNRSKKNCKIVKIRRSDKEVVQISEALRLGHGNDFAYNADNNTLIAANNHRSRALCIVDPLNLTIIRTVIVKIPEYLYGASTSQLSSIKIFNGVSYSKEKRSYVVALKGSSNMLVLNSKYMPIRYMNMSKCGSYLNQGTQCTKDYIIRVKSPVYGKSRYNVISIFDWKGRHCSTVKIKCKGELENLYIVGNTFYCGAYVSRYVKAHKIVIKKKKVKGKIKKIKKKVSYWKLRRDNYVYKVRWS
jgi:hypothetical protein